MLRFLDRLGATTDEAGKTLYVPCGLPPSEVDRLLEKASGGQEYPPELAEIAANSKTGAVLFWSPSHWSPSHMYLILPPFPIAEKSFSQGFAVPPLRSLLLQDFRIALVLVRLGNYAIGICHGEAITGSKVGTGLVHGRHKKGGSSQGRFQRHREKQIEYFLNRVCGHLREYLEPQALDYVAYGGAWTTIRLLQKRCSLLQQFDDRLLPPLLDLPEPRRAVLETAVSRVWSSRVYEWYEE